MTNYFLDCVHYMLEQKGLGGEVLPQKKGVGPPLPPFIAWGLQKSCQSKKGGGEVLPLFVLTIINREFSWLIKFSKSQKLIMGWTHYFLLLLIAIIITTLSFHKVDLIIFNILDYLKLR